jgi:hypothetical protein
MPRAGQLILSDIANKLEVLRVECPRCARAGRYAVARLMRERGPDAGLHEFMIELTADCPQRRSVDIYIQCGAVMPDLPRVV